jgi:hypothetical protein
MNRESPHLAKAILAHIIANADMVGEVRGRPIMRFEFSCEPWLMDKLAAFGVGDEDLEAEPDEAA